MLISFTPDQVESLCASATATELFELGEIAEPAEAHLALVYGALAKQMHRLGDEPQAIFFEECSANEISQWLDSYDPRQMTC